MFMASGIAVDHTPFVWELCLASEAQDLLSAGLPADLLSVSEREAFARLPAEKRRRDWLAGRLAAKRALRALDPAWGPDEIEILNAQDGRPFARVPSGAAHSFSISHCVKGGICAVSRDGSPIGVDFEPLAAHGDGVLALIMHRTELAPLDETPALWQTKLWTAKEAVLKALGLGLACDPREVRWFEAARRLELDGQARRRWLELGSPRLTVEHRPFEDALIAFAHSGGTR